MNFCPHCGAKIQFTESKYCHNCGGPLIVTSKADEPSSVDTTVEEKRQEAPTVATDKGEPDASEYLQATAYSKGSKFEDTVEAILKAEGYSTQRRLRLDGQKGKSEVDILATKKHRGKERKLIVECKNYDRAVPVKDVRDFLSKLEDLEIANGLFVAYREFSSEAKAWGEKGGLQLWDGDTVYQKFYELQVGRLKTGEEVSFDYSLPLNIDYAKAIHLDLLNKEKVEISTELIWRPFYKVYYELDCTQRDPTKRKHRITDSGFYIVDALLKTEQEDKETQIFKKELEQIPAEQQSIRQPEDYRLIKLSPHMMQGTARTQTIDHIIEKNTRTIEYETPHKRRRRKDEVEDFFFSDTPDIREWTLKPSSRDALIRDIQIVYAPKWEIEFQGKDYTYVRVMSGNSGTILTDTITYCSKHWLAEFLGVQRKNIAICDTCGQALCKEHAFKCPTCSSWRCEKDSIQCIGCNKRFCADHIKNKCIECSTAICDACVLRCPICGEVHCSGHMTKCSRCGKTVCVSCTRKEGGLLFKKRVCKNCWQS